MHVMQIWKFVGWAKPATFKYIQDEDAEYW